MKLPIIVEVVRPFRGRAAAVIALLLLDTALTSLGVGMVLPVFQSLLDPDHSSAFLAQALPALDRIEPRMRLLFVAGATVALFLMKAVVAYSSFYASQEFVQRLRFHWIDRIGEHYLYGPYRDVAERKQGELLNDWFTETYAGSRYIQAYLIFVSSTALGFALLVLSFIVHWQGTLIMLSAATALVLVVRRRMFGGAAKLSAAKIQSVQAVTSSMLENISNLRDIKLMLAERARLGELAERGRELKSILLRGAVNADRPRIVGEFLAVFAIMCLIVVSAFATDASPQTIVPVMAFIFIVFYRLFTAASQLMSARVRALNDVHSVRLVHRMATQVVEREDREHGAPIRRIETDLHLRNLGYTYDGSRAVLRNVDAVVPRGAVTLLLGVSGAGKSTLLDLLLRLAEPTEGAVEANGRPAHDFNLAQWRRCFGYVSQEVSLFNGTIRSNLLMARPEATEADLIEACRLAGAADFVTSLPAGLDTHVGDRGHTLSGGQRKRIGIARALINSPSVLILDEATASIEQSLEDEILESIRAAKPDLTVLQVTHRPRHRMNPDWVIELEHGAVVMNGPWTELKGRAYAAAQS